MLLVAAGVLALTTGAGTAAGSALSDAGGGDLDPAGSLDSLLDQVNSANPPSDKHGHEDGDDGGHEDGRHDDDASNSDFEAHSGAATKRKRKGGGGKSREATTASAASSGDTEGLTTLDQTIVGGDPAEGFQFLGLGPGEERVVRTDLAKPEAGREKRRRSLLYVAQTTDWQLADEESPARVEFLDPAANDPIPPEVAGAHRPQEAFVPFGVEMAIRQLNQFTDRSPHTQRNGKRAKMDFALLTGDQADNQQFNETRWVVRLLEGGTLDPNSGVDPSSCPPGQMPTGQTADPRLYAGVQDYDDYLEGNQFYDPDQPVGVWSDWPRYPRIMDRAQEPFEATGLNVPSYVTPGNHDGLAQGNEKALAPFEEVGTGCAKPLAPASGPTSASDLSASLDPDYIAGLLATDPDQVMLVPPDPDRQYVDKRQYKALYDTGAQSDAHGFGLVDAGELEASNGAASYYSWKARPGIRMISIDTLCEGGVAGRSQLGNLDDPQFQWLTRELERAQQRDELIIVFGHHPIRSLTCPVPDETPPPCTTEDEHGHDINPGCDIDPRSSMPVRQGADIEALFHSFPNVIAYVAGHTHENNLLAAQPDPEAQTERRQKSTGDFWGIETASLVDWPPQNRLVELMDNCDGTLSFLATIVDSSAPATAPSSGTEADVLDTADIASISRTLAYNDPQAGLGSGEGQPSERNVELLLEDPREEPSGCARRTADDDEPDEEPDEPVVVEDDTDRSGSLALTGLALGTMLLVGGGLLGGGRLLRRIGR